MKVIRWDGIKQCSRIFGFLRLEFTIPTTSSLIPRDFFSRDDLPRRRKNRLASAFCRARTREVPSKGGQQKERRRGWKRKSEWPRVSASELSMDRRTSLCPAEWILSSHSTGARKLAGLKVDCTRCAKFLFHPRGLFPGVPQLGSSPRIALLGATFSASAYILPRLIARRIIHRQC